MSSWRWNTGEDAGVVAGARRCSVQGERGARPGIRLPLPPRASLVPVFSFGENELYQQFPNPPGSWVRMAQEALQPLLRVSLPLFHGRLGLLPFRRPIYTVGEPGPARSPGRTVRPRVGV